LAALVLADYASLIRPTGYKPSDAPVVRKEVAARSAAITVSN
jgi:hypothetical protein